MTKRVYQFRYYGTNAATASQPGVGDNNITASDLTGGQLLNNYNNVIHLGIQTLPGTMFYLNDNGDIPIIVGTTGIYELDLDDTTGFIYKLRFNQASIDVIDTTLGYLIIDIVYKDMGVNS